MLVFADSLAAARKAAVYSNYYSNQSEDEGKGLRYRKPNRRYHQDTSSDDGEDRISNYYSGDIRQYQ